MGRPDFAQRLDDRRAALQWAQQVELPDEMRRVYEQAAGEIAAALTHETYRFALQLPHLFYLNRVLISVPRRSMNLRAGSPIDTLRRRSCRHAILKNLGSLCRHSNAAAASLARFVSFLTARHILFDLVASVQEIEALNQASRQEVERLSHYAEWMRLVEQLYPAWVADDLYDEKYSRLTMHLTTQGRALAAAETQQMIDELIARWHGGDSLRGLKLLIPYLDERHYRMQVYEVVVIPSGRIPFRPEFVVGACRVEEQRVRKNPQLTQATRWQLISQLDSVIQAFEVIIHETVHRAITS